MIAHCTLHLLLHNAHCIYISSFLILSSSYKSSYIAQCLLHFKLLGKHIILRNAHRIFRCKMHIASNKASYIAQCLLHFESDLSLHNASYKVSYIAKCTLHILLHNAFGILHSVLYCTLHFPSGLAFYIDHCILHFSFRAYNDEAWKSDLVK